MLPEAASARLLLILIFIQPSYFLVVVERTNDGEQQICTDFKYQEKKKLRKYRVHYIELHAQLLCSLSWS